MPKCPRTLIMVVEDDELNMKLMRDIFEAHGYLIIQSRNGQNALQTAHQERPDLILMDIRLPDISGLHIIKTLKEDESFKKIPIIALTALAMPGDEEKIRRGGADVYISKPTSITHLITTIKNMLEGHNSQEKSKNA